MSALVAGFRDKILSAVDKQIADKTDIVASGGCSDWTDYKSKVERIKTLKEIKGNVKDAFAKQMGEDED